MKGSLPQAESRWAVSRERARLACDFRKNSFHSTDGDDRIMKCPGQKDTNFLEGGFVGFVYRLRFSLCLWSWLPFSIHAVLMNTQYYACLPRPFVKTSPAKLSPAKTRLQQNRPTYYHGRDPTSNQTRRRLRHNRPIPYHRRRQTSNQARRPGRHN